MDFIRFSSSSVHQRVRSKYISHQPVKRCRLHGDAEEDHDLQPERQGVEGVVQCKWPCDISIMVFSLWFPKHTLPLPSPSFVVSSNSLIFCELSIDQTACHVHRCRNCHCFICFVTIIVFMNVHFFLLQFFQIVCRKIELALSLFHIFSF